MAIGKEPISMKYVPDMNKHFRYGSDKILRNVNKKSYLLVIIIIK